MRKHFDKAVLTFVLGSMIAGTIGVAVYANKAQTVTAMDSKTEQIMESDAEITYNSAGQLTVTDPEEPSAESVAAYNFDLSICDEDAIARYMDESSAAKEV